MKIVSVTIAACFASCLTVAFVDAQEKSQDRTTANKLDPAGTWRWEYELGGQTFKDSLKLNLSDDRKLTGTYQGRDKPVPLSDLKFEDGTLTFPLTVDYQGTSVKLAFKGKVKGDDIDGSVTATTSEGSQDFPWAPKRSVQWEDVLGQWQMRIEAGERTLEPVVTITKDGEKYKAKYVSGDQLNVEATELKIEKNELSFKVAANVNGTEVKADYKGRPYGDKIEGSIAYVLGDNSGDIEFTGVRKSTGDATAINK